MNSVSDMDKKIERLTDLLVPYLCERTGLSHDQVVAVLHANDTFWEQQPSVIASMVIFEMPDEDDEQDG